MGNLVNFYWEINAQALSNNNLQYLKLVKNDYLITWQAYKAYNCSN